MGKCTQEDIARRLNVSRVKVHRLVSQALEEGLVKVFVEGAPVECLALEDALSQRFGLQFCTVVPDLEDGEATDPAAVFHALGVAGARFLHQYLDSTESAVIGVGHGRTLAAVVDRLPRIRRPGSCFVSLIGSLTRRSAANPFDVVHRLAERTGGDGYLMPVPFVADTIADKTVLMAQRIVREAVAQACRAELVLVGIGELGPRSHMLASGQITAAEFEELKAAGAVGDLLGRFYDAEGRPVEAEANERKLGLPAEDLPCRNIVAVAGGASKAKAICAALLTDTVTGLITDERAARAIIDRPAGRRPTRPTGRPAQNGSKETIDQGGGRSHAKALGGPV